MEALMMTRAMIRRCWGGRTVRRAFWCVVGLAIFCLPAGAEAQSRPGMQNRPVSQARPATPPGQLIPPGQANQAVAPNQGAPNQMRPAQPTARDIANAEALVQQVRERSAAAQTMEEYNEIIQLCVRAKKSPISQNSALYLDQMLSWSYNRRGEYYLEKSAALVTENKKSEAKKLDTQALAEFERAVKYDPSRWKAYHNRGICYASAGRSDLAIVDFTRVTKLNPDYSNAWFNRAELHYDRREYEHAVADYSEVIRMKPADVAAYTGRGHSYYQLSRYREALVDYERTVEISANDPHAITNRADALARLGQWERAATDYRVAVELDPALARAYQGAAWLMATCPDEKIRNPKLALQSAKKAIELNGEENSKFLDTLAAAYANVGQFEEAKALVSRAVAISPEEAEPLKVRMASYEQGQPYRVSRTATKPADQPRVKGR